MDLNVQHSILLGIYLFGKLGMCDRGILCMGINSWPDSVMLHPQKGAENEIICVHVMSKVVCIVNVYVFRQRLPQ